MRPCRECGAAVQNNQEVCPECGAPAPTKRTGGPPPETGPGVTGDPVEERMMMLSLLIPPVIVGLVATFFAVRHWGPWGILAGLGAGFVAFLVRLTLASF